jgi:hypothetical protein
MNTPDDALDGMRSRAGLSIAFLLDMARSHAG